MASISMDNTQKSKSQADKIEIDDKDILIGTKSAVEATKKAKKKRTKSIGKAIIQAESKKENNPKTKKPSIDANNLVRQDLMQIAANIEVNDSTLLKIYETKLINEKALRSLVNMHLSDEDIRPALREAIIDETSHFGETQVAESKKEEEYNRKRILDTLFIVGLTTVVVLFIVFMVSRF